MTNEKFFMRAILIAAGAVLICSAVVFNSENYAPFLLGENLKDLSFGPALFRALLFFHGAGLTAAAFFAMRNAQPEKHSAAERNRFETNRTTQIRLAFLTLLALVLRLWKSNTDLWTDEVFTLLDFARKPFGEILTSFQSQNQHFLYSILARASISVWGESAWALRLPAVLFGAGCVPVLFLLCRRLLGAKAALLAAALMTVSYHHIWFSQNARGYTGLLFFTLLATELWFRALEKNTYVDWFAYSAAIVGGMWIHLTMAFVVGAQGLIFFAFLTFPKLANDNAKLEKRALCGISASWILSATVTLQLYALALPEFLTAGLHEESKNSEWTNWFWALTELYRSFNFGLAGILAAFVGTLFVVFGWLKLFEKNRRAAILMMLSPLLAGAFIFSAGHNLFPRFFFFAMGYGLIIIVCAAIEIPKFLLGIFKARNSRFKIQNRLGEWGLACLILISALTVPRNYALPKQDFSGARDFVEINRRPDEKIVAVRIAGELYARYFAPDWNNVKTERDLEKIEREEAGNIWLVYTLTPEIKAFRPELWQRIAADFETVKVFHGTLNGGEIYVCRPRLKEIIEVKNEPTGID